MAFLYLGVLIVLMKYLLMNILYLSSYKVIDIKWLMSAEKCPDILDKIMRHFCLNVSLFYLKWVVVF